MEEPIEAFSGGEDQEGENDDIEEGVVGPHKDNDCHVYKVKRPHAGGKADDDPFIGGWARGEVVAFPDVDTEQYSDREFGDPSEGKIEGVIGVNYIADYDAKHNGKTDQEKEIEFIK